MSWCSLHLPALTDGFNSVFSRHNKIKNDKFFNCAPCEYFNCCDVGQKCESLGLRIDSLMLTPVLTGTVLPCASCLAFSHYFIEFDKLKWINRKWKALDGCLTCVAAPFGMTVKILHIATGVICPDFVFKDPENRLLVKFDTPVVKIASMSVGGVAIDHKSSAAGALVPVNYQTAGQLETLSGLSAKEAIALTGRIQADRKTGDTQLQYEGAVVAVLELTPVVPITISPPESDVMDRN